MDFLTFERIAAVETELAIERPHLRPRLMKMSTRVSTQREWLVAHNGTACAL
jgi:hypothetical protein